MDINILNKTYFSDKRLSNATGYIGWPTKGIVHYDIVDGVTLTGQFAYNETDLLALLVFFLNGSSVVEEEKPQSMFFHASSYLEGAYKALEMWCSTVNYYINMYKELNS